MYARTIAEQDLNFQVSGKLWRRSLVMRDVETGTLWSHLLGRGMEGKHIDYQLETIPSAMTTWNDWKQRHPDTTLLGMSRTARRYLEEAWSQPSQFVFGLLLGAGKPAPAVGLEKLQKDKVVSVKVDDIFFVVTHSKAGGSVQAFDSRIDDKKLTFQASDGEAEQISDAESGSTWDVVTGKAVGGPLKGKQLTPVSGTISFTRAWRAFFPDDPIVN